MLPKGVHSASGPTKRVPPEKWIVEDVHMESHFANEDRAPLYEPEDPEEGDGDPS